MLLTAGRVVTPARILAPGWVHVDGDRIVDVGAGDPPRAADVPLPAATLVPGFVDTHVHTVRPDRGTPAPTTRTC